MKKLRTDDTGKIDKSTKEHLALVYPVFDEDYLNDLIAKAKHNWQGIDPDEWLQNFRGEYEV